MSFDPVWFMVAASVIATIGIAVLFNQSMLAIQTEMDRDPQAASHGFVDKQRTSFLLKAAIVESLPMILIVIGFMQGADSGTTRDTMDIILPLVIIIGVFAASIFGIWSALRQALSHHDIDGQPVSHAIRAYGFLAIAFVGVIPIISVMFTLFILG